MFYAYGTTPTGNYLTAFDLTTHIKDAGLAVTITDSIRIKIDPSHRFVIIWNTIGKYQWYRVNTTAFSVIGGNTSGSFTFSAPNDV